MSPVEFSDELKKKHEEIERLSNKIEKLKKSGNAHEPVYVNKIDDLEARKKRSTTNLSVVEQNLLAERDELNKKIREYLARINQIRSDISTLLQTDLV